MINSTYDICNLCIYKRHIRINLANLTSHKIGNIAKEKGIPFSTRIMI